MEQDTQAQAPAIELVPVADRPFQPAEHAEARGETLWENPTDKDVVLDMHVSMPQGGRRPRGWEDQTGKRRYVLKANTVRAIDSDFDMAIQHMQCREDSCLQRPFSCRNRGHRKQIVGGLGPQLINKGMQHRPTLAPSLDEALAQEAAIRKQLTDLAVRKMQDDQALRSAQDELARVNSELERKRTQLEQADVRASTASSEKARK